MSASLNLAHRNTEETSYVIIQCTKCRTRFAVESEEIETLSDPKFHCSHCDHIFQEGDDLVAETIPAEKASRAATIAAVPNQAGPDEGVVAVYRNSTKIASFFRPAKAVIKPEDSAAKKDRFNNLYSPNDTRQLQIPKRWDDTMHADAPRESASARELLMENESIASEISNSQNDVKAQTMPTRIPNAHESEDTIEIEAFGAVKNTPLSEGQFNHYKADSLMPLQSRNPRATQKNGTRSVNFWSHLAVPVLFFLTALLALALVLQTSGSFSSKFVKSLIPGALTPAPGDLFIKDTKFEKVTLDSGETTRIITGTVVNNSENSYSGAELETVLFDRSGKPLGTIRTKLNSNLATAKIHALTPDMIRDIQTGAGSKHLVLRPGEEHEFAVALLGSEFALAKDFATRIYSAKEL